jgi:hypothetical protein
MIIRKAKIKCTARNKFAVVTNAVFFTVNTMFASTASPYTKKPVAATGRYRISIAKEIKIPLQFQLTNSISYGTATSLCHKNYKKSEGLFVLSSQDFANHICPVL